MSKDFENHDFQPIFRTVNLGGIRKEQLIEQLLQQGVRMNMFAEQLIHSKYFTTSSIASSIKTIELTLRNIGLTQGAHLIEIFDAAQKLDLSLCPLELALHLRLEYMDQQEGYLGKPIREHAAPYGSLTVASKLLTKDEAFPKGFYLRCIEGRPYLHGYISSLDHLWQLDDHFVFMIEEGNVYFSSAVK